MYFFKLYVYIYWQQKEGEMDLVYVMMYVAYPVVDF